MATYLAYNHRDKHGWPKGRVPLSTPTVLHLGRRVADRKVVSDPDNCQATWVQVPPRQHRLDELGFQHRTCDRRPLECRHNNACGAQDNHQLDGRGRRETHVWLQSHLPGGHRAVAQRRGVCCAATRVFEAGDAQVDGGEQHCLSPRDALGGLC